MPIHVELFGIPRQRAGIAKLEIDSPKNQLTLSELLIELAERFPALKQDCVQNGRLGPGVVANLGGEQFVSDPSCLIAAGQSVLIMSADAGG